jgi:hypothetical protein
VLQDNCKVPRPLLRVALVVLLTCAVSWPADGPLTPLTVCEVLRDLAAQNGKTAAVLGRYSYRESGRWLGEQACAASPNVTPQLILVEDLTDGPKPPNDFAIDGASLHQKLASMQHGTSLGKFRFGTPDYDRWAVIYGRVQERKGDDAKKAPANLVFRGSGVIVFLNPE